MKHYLVLIVYNEERDKSRSYYIDAPNMLAAIKYAYSNLTTYEEDEIYLILVTESETFKPKQDER